MRFGGEVCVRDGGAVGVEAVQDARRTEDGGAIGVRAADEFGEAPGVDIRVIELLVESLFLFGL
ncbi:MAG TPA: hypothetical protein VGB61_06665, partial [Pyrinomonadaceae bacterium]